MTIHEIVNKLEQKELFAYFRVDYHLNLSFRELFGIKTLVHFLHLYIQHFPIKRSARHILNIVCICSTICWHAPYDTFSVGQRFKSKAWHVCFSLGQSNLAGHTLPWIRLRPVRFNWSTEKNKRVTRSFDLNFWPTPNVSFGTCQRVLESMKTTFNIWRTARRTAKKTQYYSLLHVHGQ